MGTPPRKRPFRAHIRNITSLAGVVGPAVLAATTIITHTFSENYDWTHQTISQLGLGPHGWIENTGFIIFGVLMVVFAEALYAGFRARRSLIAATVAWVLVGLGFIVIGVFHADPHGVMTLHGQIHTQATRALALLFPLVCFLLIPCFEGDPHWDRMVAYTLVAGGLAVLLDSLGFLLVNTRFHQYSGLYERLMAFNALAWLEVVAIHLLPHRRDLG